MNKKGFTLVELLIVVLIIGVLSGIALPQYRKVVARSRFTRAQVMAKSIYDSVERYLAVWGKDSWYDLPVDKRKLSRLDIGATRLLPAGFSLNDSTNTISGGGFSYQWLGSTVGITATSGAYTGAVIVYTGNSFNCQTDVNGEACAIFGVE